MTNVGVKSEVNVCYKLQPPYLAYLSSLDIDGRRYAGCSEADGGAIHGGTLQHFRRLQRAAGVLVLSQTHLSFVRPNFMSHDHFTELSLNCPH